MTTRRMGWGVVAGLAVLLLAGCRSFEKEWQAAPSGPGIEGRWVGTWQNTNNSHAGPLRAILVRKGDGKEGDVYAARFHAGWGKRTGSFRTVLRGGMKDGEFQFRGRRRILGVPIRTDGWATPERIESGYDSPFDRGTFSLRREAEGR